MHRTARTLFPALSLAIILGVTGCARFGSAPTEADEPSASDGRPAQSIRPVQTVPPSTDAVVGEVPPEILDAILAAAAERSGVAASDLEVTMAEQITWSDGSLGCPEPGQMYTQALVDGYHIVIVAGDEELDYRVGSGGSFRLCEGGPPGGG
jgi:hypothetical protein